MSEPTQPDDAVQEAPATPPGPQTADEPAVSDEFAEGRTSDPGGAQRDVPAGEDYAGSGF